MSRSRSKNTPPGPKKATPELHTPWWRRAINVAVLGVAFGGGFFSRDFLDFGGKHRELSRIAVEQNVEASRAIEPLLRKLSKQALNGTPLDDSDREELRTILQKQYNSAATTAKSIPSVKGEFEKYADAIVAFQKSALNFKGPLDASTFVKDISNYLSTQDAFQTEAIRAQQSYFRSLLRAL